jgi:predicted aminopeptidase
MNVVTLPLVLLLTVVLSGCVDFQYYRQSIKGHLEIVRQKQDIEELLTDDALDPNLERNCNLF